MRTRKKQIAVWVLLCLTLSVTLFIFSNSAKNAEQSSQQSDPVVDAVRPPAEIILPIIDVEPSRDNIVTIVRTMAHGLEFALLGCLAFWTVWLWNRRAWVRGVVPFWGCVLIAFCDEAIQLTSPGRAFQWSDLLTDTIGAACGILFAWLCAVSLRLLIKKRHQK